MEDYREISDIINKWGFDAPKVGVDTYSEAGLKLVTALRWADKEIERYRLMTSYPFLIVPPECEPGEVTS